MAQNKTGTSSKAAAKPAAAAVAEGVRRRRGRPPLSNNGLLDRKLIIACAFELAKTKPLQDLSIVQVARELGVTAPLIHYYLDGRDALTSGVMNSFYREMLSEWPAASGRWREDIESTAHHIYQICVTYGGVAAYLVSHNRFRLVQLTRDGEPDYGLLLFERFVGVIREAGFDAQRTAMYANLLMELVISGAYATVRHRWPGYHGDLLEEAFAGLNPRAFPNTCFVRKKFTRLTHGLAFADGMNLVLSGLALERSKLGLEDKPAQPAA